MAAPDGYVELTATDGTTLFLLPLEPAPVVIDWGDHARVFSQGGIFDVEGTAAEVAAEFPPVEKTVHVLAPLFGDGSTGDPIGIDAASALGPGSMSAADFAKLARITQATYAPTVSTLAGGMTVGTIPALWSVYQIDNMVIVRGVLQASFTGTTAGASCRITLPSTPASGFQGSGWSTNSWIRTSAQTTQGASVAFAAGVTTITFDLAITETLVNYQFMLTYLL